MSEQPKEYDCRQRIVDIAETRIRGRFWAFAKEVQNEPEFFNPINRSNYEKEFSIWLRDKLMDEDASNE